MERTVKKIETLEARIDRFRQQQVENPEIDLSGVDLADIEDEELREVLEVGKGLFITWQISTSIGGEGTSSAIRSN